MTSATTTTLNTITPLRSSQLPLTGYRSPTLIKVLANAAYHLPFYVFLMDELVTVISVPADHPLIRTAATDGKRCWVNDGFAARLFAQSPKQALFLLAHEMEHVVGDDMQAMVSLEAIGHVIRMSDPTKSLPFDGHHFNVAADAIINANLLRTATLAMPTNPDGTPMGVLDSRIDPEKHTRLHAYEIMWKDKPPSEGSRPGEGNPGEGGGLDVHVENDLPDATKPGDPQRELEIERAIEAAHAACPPGSTPAHMLARLQAMRDKRTVRWQDHLRQLTRRSLTQAAQFDWTRIDRRRYQLYGLLCPPRFKPVSPPLAVIIDTSGSTSSHRAPFLAEVIGLALELKPESVTIVFCDTRVQRIDTFKPDALVRAAESLTGIDFPQGGGTQLAPAFAALADLPVAPKAIVVLTDSAVWDWPDTNPLGRRTPCIVATTGPGRSHPDWMTVVGIPK